MNQQILVPAVPFPNIFWWQKAVYAESVLLDKAEHFQKMSFRNRYLIAGPDGVISLSIPIAEGRQQRKPMGLVGTDNRDKWQLRHWRTLQSAYNRSPYFEFYRDQLEPLFAAPYANLWDFNVASIEVLCKLLNVSTQTIICEEYISVCSDSIQDLRRDFLVKNYTEKLIAMNNYYQVFSDRTGFLPNLSIIDLLFNEGPGARSFLSGL